MPSAVQRGADKESVSKIFLRNLFKGTNNFNSLNKLVFVCSLRRVHFNIGFLRIIFFYFLYEQCL